MHYLENILSWKTDKLHGYGWFHLIIIVINVCITIVFIRRYKNHNEKQVKMTVFYFGLFFFFLELYKQLFINVFEDRSSYNWSTFPFQFCSTPIYICLLTPVFKEKIREYLYQFMGFYYTIAGLSVMVVPDSVITSEVTITMQSLLWHGAMITLGVYLIITRNLGCKIKEMIPGILLFCSLTCLAIAMNYFFEQMKNQYNLSDSFNMFLISPYYNSTVPVLSKIWDDTNWYVFVCCYIISVNLGALCIFGITYYIKKYINFRKVNVQNRNDYQ